MRHSVELDICWVVQSVLRDVVAEACRVVDFVPRAGGEFDLGSLEYCYCKPVFSRKGEHRL